MSIKDSCFKDDDDDDDDDDDNIIANTEVSIVTGLRAGWFLKARGIVLSERYEMNLLSVEGVRDIAPSCVGIGVAWVGEGGNAPPPYFFT
jgi:hypothetical protein